MSTTYSILLASCLKINYPKYMGSHIIKSKSGFTLIELLVSIAIFAILISSLALAINPFKQIDRARDAKRISDIAEVARGLDLFYEDNNCYVASNTLNNLLATGGEWDGATSATVLIKKIPTDTDGYRYQYITDSTSCPQWGVIFAHLTIPQTSVNTCALSAISSCVPAGYDSHWACVVRGNPDCSVLTSNQLIVPTPSAVPTVTPIPTQQQSQSPTPTPNNQPTNTPVPCDPSQKNYVCSGQPSRCNVVAQGTGTYCSSNCDGACL